MSRVALRFSNGDVLAVDEAELDHWLVDYGGRPLPIVTMHDLDRAGQPGHGESGANLHSADRAVTDRQANLFDVHDATGFGPVRDMRVAPCSTSDVTEFCREWHYTGRGGSIGHAYGLWDGFTLVGVVAYNLPTMEACGCVFGADQWASVLHMGRLVCAEDAPRNVESRLIAGSLRALMVDKPNTRAVLTYAAVDAGHLGYVYQATNALYTGRGGHAVYFVDQAGTRRPDYYDGQWISRTDALSRGWRVVEGETKHRYVYLTGDRTQRRASRKALLLAVLPYPKNTERVG